MLTLSLKSEHYYFAVCIEQGLLFNIIVSQVFIFGATGVLGTISRMAKMCALRLTPTKLYFILTDNAAVGGVSIWCELTQVNSY